MLVYGVITLLLYSTNCALVIKSALKCCFGYSRCHGATAMLSDLRLPCFDLLFSKLIVLTVLRVDGSQVRMF